MIRKANIDDLTLVTDFAFLLWPNNIYENLKNEIEEILLNKNSIFFLYFIDNSPVGFVQCQLRFDYVEGTSSSPVGYLEGIYVDEKHRKRGIARKLLNQCESWAKKNKCVEFGSDCELDNIDSLDFHLKVGFTEANRIICFNKKL